MLFNLVLVKTWMDSNPDEGLFQTSISSDSMLTGGRAVVVLLIVNIDDLPATEFAPVFEAANVTSISYQPGISNMTASSWPTLGSLIDNGTRLLTFLDNSADITTVPYLLDGERNREFP